jgi:hypothetical protein
MGGFLRLMSEYGVSMSEFWALMSEFSVSMGEYKKAQSFRKK